MNWNILQAPPGGWAFDTWPGHGQDYAGNNGTGIPFHLLGTAANNVWLGNTTQALTISMDVANPTAVFTLFNTHWGRNVNEVSVEFVGSAGADALYILRGGRDIRDWYNGNFTNGVSGLAEEWWHGSTPKQGVPPNPSRLDMQSFVLGAAFQSQHLQQIIITTQAAGGSGGFEPFLSGLTVQTLASNVPEPDTWSLFLAGAGIVGLRRRLGARGGEVPTQA